MLALILITISFREPTSGPLHGVQSAGATVLRPFEVAADRVSRPFRDAAGWAHGLVDAKSENKKLRRQVESLRQQLVQDESAVQENVQLKQALEYKGPPSLANFDRVHASVLTYPQSAIDESITIAAGTHDGLAEGNVVITPQGLVGTVEKAWGNQARVTLLTDGQSAVTARDLTSPAAVGIVKRGGGDVLVFDRVPKAPWVAVGDTVVTAGSVGRGELPSMFPRGIQIGTVASQSNNDVNTFKTIQLKPFVDFATLQSVIVLVPRPTGAGG